ncbi:MAG: LCP family protein [Anaerolineaceae bacterium]
MQTPQKLDFDMRLKRYQVITLLVFVILTVSFLGVILSGVIVSAMANSETSPYQVSLKGNQITPTPFQPNSFANILEDGTIELLPQPVHTPTPVPTIAAAQMPTNQMNILLLGVDDFAANGFRTDVIMLLSLNPKHNTASLISFPRDLYVTIPGYWSNRINTAWGLGGFELLADTFEVNFGIRPEYYMMVNYNGFKDVIDSLGGIDVTVTQELQDSCSTDPSGWCILEPGETHMDGSTALWYSRSRLTTSDFDRNRRAQEVVQAIFQKIMNLNMLLKVPELYSYYREYVDTDVQLMDIIPMLPLASSLMEEGNIHRYAIGPESVTNWITAEGAMVLMPDYYAIAEILNEALYLNE